MAAVSFYSGFEYKWGQTGDIIDLQDNQYKLGWAFIGSTPPSVEQFNKLQQLNDEKFAWLWGQFKQAADARKVTIGADDLLGLNKLLTAVTPDATTAKKGLAAFATDAEARALTSKTKILTPYGLGLNITQSSNDVTAGRLLKVGDFGIGGNMVTPPKGRSSLNPMGLYYQASPTSFGGGSFFVEMPYSSTVGGFRLSNDPYKDRYYLNSWNKDTSTYSAAVELFHTGNFDPGQKADKSELDGFQESLDGKQPKGNYQTKLGYTPVNKAGDTMTGNLVTSGNVEAKNRLITGAWGDWSTGVMIDNNNVWLGNDHNRFRLGRDQGNLSLWLYSGTGDYLGNPFTVDHNQVMHFGKPPMHAGKRLAVFGDVCPWEGSVIEFGSSVAPGGDYMADCPWPYVLVGLRTINGKNSTYLRGVKLLNG